MNVNSITKALIAANLIDNVVGIEHQAPSSYVFSAERTESVTDIITDSKLVRQMTNLAYTGLVGAILRQEGNNKPLFDDEDEDNEYDGFTPPTPMSIEEAVYNAAVIWRIAQHYARMEGNEWLSGITKLTTTKDANGNLVVVRTTDAVVRPFHEWLQVECERNAPETNWGASVSFAKQLGWTQPGVVPSVGVDEARDALTAWLDAMPYNRDGTDITRREKIVTAVADRKWRDLVAAACSGNNKAVEKAQKDWVLIAHSPNAKRDIAQIKASVAYQLHEQKKQLDELTAMKEQLELEEMRAEFARTKAELLERMQALRATPVQPTAPAPAPEAPQHNGTHVDSIVRMVPKHSNMPTYSNRR
jgi:hypothetical protein